MRKPTSGKSAELQFDRAVVLHNQGNLADARQAYKNVLKIDPDHAGALHFLGVIAIQANDPQRGSRLIEKSIKMNPLDAVAHSNRGMALLALDRPEEALSSFDRAISLKPDYVDARYNRGVALVRLARFDEGLASFDEAIALNPNHETARYNKSFQLLRLGRFGEGWKLYELRRRKGGPVATRDFPQPLWSGEQDLKGKTLFVHWEQGLGDTLQFCRYAPLIKARGARVVFSVQDPLVRLLRQWEPEIEIIGGGEQPKAFDYHCPLMSLPLAAGTTLDTIPSRTPYLRADDTEQSAWSGRLSHLTGLKVGLAWAGGPGPPNEVGGGSVDQRRSIEVGRLAPLLTTPGVDFVSLQKGIAASQLRALPPRLRPIDHMDDVSDFADTAALIANLDLVITVDTSVAHLAGALGKPVWILSRLDGCWRWLTEREDSPWYPTARLFRQPRPNDWEPVIASVSASLAEVSAGRPARGARFEPSP